MSEGLDQVRYRLDRLERQNRQLRWMVRLLALPLAAMVLMAAAGHQESGEGAQIAPSPEMHAQRFVLVDSAGRERAVLGLGSNGPFLHFLAASGTDRGTAPVSLDVQGLTVSATGTTGAALNAQGLTIAGVNGRALLDAQSLSLEPARSGAEASLHLGESGPSLRLKDAKGGLAVMGVQSFAPSPGGVARTTGAASITLVGPNHRVLWSAPGIRP